MKAFFRLFVPGFIAVACSASAITSVFNSDAEGWTSFNNGSEQVAWSATNGNPGGHITLGDNNSGWTYFQAPAAFTAQPLLYNGSMSFDMRTSSSVGASNLYKVRVGLTGGGLILINESTIPTTAWQNYNFGLSTGVGWRVFSTLSQNYSTSAPLATLTQMQSVLGSINNIYIAADYNDLTVPSQDTAHLDNVNITAVPEPTTLATIVIGGLLFTRRRRS